MYSVEIKELKRALKANPESKEIQLKLKVAIWNYNWS